MAASPITPTRDSLSVATLRQLNINTSGDNQVSLAITYDALNKATQQVCRDFPALEKIDTLTISSSAEGAALPSDFLRLKMVLRMAGDTLRHPLQIINIDSLPYMIDSVAVQSKRSIRSPQYAYTYASRLLTHPKYIIPSNADSFLVYYYAMDDKLTAASDSLVIDDSFVPAVLYHACFQLAAQKRDFEVALFWLGRYDAERDAVGKPRALELKK